MELREMLQYIFNNYLKDYNNYGGKVQGNYKKDLSAKLEKSVSGISGKFPNIDFDVGIGTGYMTFNPYITIMRTDLNITAKKGYYLVYLFSKDMSKVYLSFNQGISEPELSKPELEKLSNIIKQFFISSIRTNNGFNTNKIDIGATTDVPKKYTSSHIYGKEYSAAALPSNSELIADLESAIKIYLAITDILYKNDNETNEINKKILEGSLLNEDSVEELKSKLSYGSDTKMNKNMILYGPPGTGKTYNTVNYAVAIIEDKNIDDVKEENYKTVLERYNKYKEDGQVAFTTFHQSYGYEEFIEGLKPVLSNTDDNNDIKYNIENGIFKDLCERAETITAKIDDTLTVDKESTVWKISLFGARENPIKTECFNKDVIRIGWDNDDEKHDEEYIEKCGSGDQGTIRSFKEEMRKGDFVLSLYDKQNIDGIGIITSDYYYDNTNYKQYKRCRNVKWFAKNIKLNIHELNGGVNLTLKTVYELWRIKKENLINIINKLNADKKEEAIEDVQKNDKKYIFIIDEINRGNISKIFGELITLIEESKRLGAPEAAEAILPYSKRKFGVPDNVYIIGTMNTADRSIALMDTALRRRFNFIEMMPDIKVLDNVKVDEIDISKMLKTINERIECLFDREHTIGHAYFIPLTEDASLNNLADIFKNKIIPLLQEYFYEDYSKIQLVLGDNEKDDEYKFIKDEKIKSAQIFKGNIDIDLDEKKYSINEEAFYKAQSYRLIY